MSETLLSVQGQLVGIPVEEYTGVSGIIVDPVNKTIRPDETVLWENTNGIGYASFPITLSESISNFERIRFYWRTFNGNYHNAKITEIIPIDTNILLDGTIYNSANNGCHSMLWALNITNNTTLNHIEAKYNNWTNTTLLNAESMVLLYKVVGVNRIANN